MNQANRVRKLANEISLGIHQLKTALGDYEEALLTGVLDGEQGMKVEVEERWALNLVEAIRTLKLDLEIRTKVVEDRRVVEE